ncbi:hypothetical protein C8J57DRAFT_1249117 [Mycena rebaudengoi]|nr:hypothetical protein C8J57DRAFT_1249117 [Mycena rebaudengoi]
MPQNSPGSITKWHRALTKGESALPKRVTSWAQSNISSEDAGVGTILELEPDISGRGGGASTRSTELQPRLNVPCQTSWGLQRGSKISAEIRLAQKSRRSFGLNVLCQTWWSLQLGSKLSVELCLQLDSKIAAKDAGVGTILEVDPDIFSGGGGTLARTTELRPRLTVASLPASRTFLGRSPYCVCLSIIPISGVSSLALNCWCSFGRGHKESTLRPGSPKFVWGVVINHIQPWSKLCVTCRSSTEVFEPAGDSTMLGSGYLALVEALPLAEAPPPPLKISGSSSRIVPTPAIFGSNF